MYWSGYLFRIESHWANLLTTAGLPGHDTKGRALNMRHIALHKDKIICNHLKTTLMKRGGAYRLKEGMGDTQGGT